MTRKMNRVELGWPGKYDNDGNLNFTIPNPLPFQIVERVNETRATREARENRMATLFDVWESTNTDGPGEVDWRNKIIWGDNKLVMASLLQTFTGKFSLIYMDPPFAVGSNFNIDIQIGDTEIEKTASVIEEVAYRDTWGNGITSYIEMLAERIRLAHILLATDSSIFIHCDYRTAAYTRLILDDVFGADNFQNEIIWSYGAGGNPKAFFPRKHDSILWYSKGTPTFNLQGGIMRVPYDKSTLDTHYKNVDSDGRLFRLQKVNGREYKTYADEGKLVTDVWTDIGGQNATSPISGEATGYPTQKPEKLLERIIHAASKPGDLVGDFFCGSGTTLAIAEKLKRNWIGADLGRFAIHTSRKRLLNIADCRPFEILNLGNYERQYWSNISFGEDLDDDGRISLLEYITFILKLYGASPTSGGIHIHGKKNSSFVHIGSVSSPVTINEIEEAIEECLHLHGKELHILGWEWEMGLIDTLTDFASRKGVKLSAFQIPREVMEIEAARKGDIKFFELSYLEMKINEKSSMEFVCNLTDFVIPNPELVPEKVREQVKNWSDYVDYWAVDWDFQNDTFMPKWMDYRSKANRDLELKSGKHKFEKSGTYKVMVKVVDIFGNDTTKIVDLKVK
jgi:adenine-specific DNA-methyltransferase